MHLYRLRCCGSNESVARSSREVKLFTSVDSSNSSRWSLSIKCQFAGIETIVSAGGSRRTCSERLITGSGVFGFWFVWDSATRTDRHQWLLMEQRERERHLLCASTVSSSSRLTQCWELKTLLELSVKWLWINGDARALGMRVPKSTSSSARSRVSEEFYPWRSVVQTYRI